MAATLFSVPISATDSNLFTYTGNITGAMSTYNNNISGIIAGGVGQDPLDIFDEYNPALPPEFSSIVNFQSGRTYQVIGKNATFLLGVSGTRTVALPDNRYIHGRPPGTTGSEINMIGFDDTMRVSPLSTAFAKQAVFIDLDNGIQIYANDDNNFRSTFKFWNTALQSNVDQYINSPNATLRAQAQAILNNPGFIRNLDPLSSYIVYNFTTETRYISAVRTKNYLLSNAKDFQFDNIFITTDDGRYLSV